MNYARAECLWLSEIGQQVDIVANLKAHTRPRVYNFYFDTSPSLGGGDGVHSDLDRVHYHEFDAVVQSESVLTTDTWQASVESFRCDKAPYIARGPNNYGGCIFDDMGAVMPYSISANNADPTKNVRQVAEHIKWAQEKPHETVFGAGVKIPGGVASGKPLTRLYTDPAYDVLNQYGQNRSTARAKCVEKFGPNYTQGPNGEQYQCDEYPFASTFEGAYSTVMYPNSAWKYSVKPLNGKQNENAGRMLGNWMTDDHILHTDPFWVRIDP
jgi:hypothetical protein